MAYGLQVWNGSGQLMIDVSDRIYSLYGRYSVSVVYPGADSGTVTVPGMSSDGTWLLVSSHASSTAFYPDVYTKVQTGGFTWVRGALGTYTAVVSVYRG